VSAPRRSDWSGALGTTVEPPVTNAGQYRVQTIRLGKRIAPSVPRQSADRKKIYLFFIHQLDAAIRERARAIEWFHQEGPLPKSLQVLITGFFTEVTLAIDATVYRKRSGAPTTLGDARQLNSKVSQFESNLELQLTHAHKHALALAVCLRDLCDDVRHYIKQIEITANVVHAKNGAPMISNRPTNWSAKEALASLVMEFQEAHGDEAWPKGSAMQAKLHRLGHACSERAVRGWLQQMKSGSAGLFIQPTKSRQ
jgi:hypothetical protein